MQALERRVLVHHWSCLIDRCVDTGPLGLITMQPGCLSVDRVVAPTLCSLAQPVLCRLMKHGCGQRLEQA